MAGAGLLAGTSGASASTATLASSVVDLPGARVSVARWSSVRPGAPLAMSEIGSARSVRLLVSRQRNGAGRPRGGSSAPAMAAIRKSSVSTAVTALAARSIHTVSCSPSASKR